MTPGGQQFEATESDVRRLLAVVRLGDANRLGWWGPHSLDQPAEFVLSQAFRSTWMATGIEMSMESTRIRHQAELERDTAIYLFSDHLPFRRLLEAWLIELKLERDMSSVDWLREAAAEDLENVDGTDICRVDVEASPQPVFARFKRNDDALFFVRLNNSTRQLSTRETLDYVRQHWP